MENKLLLTKGRDIHKHNIYKSFVLFLFFFYTPCFMNMIQVSMGKLNKLCMLPNNNNMESNMWLCPFNPTRRKLQGGIMNQEIRTLKHIRKQQITLYKAIDFTWLLAYHLRFSRPHRRDMLKDFCKTAERVQTNKFIFSFN